MFAVITTCSGGYSRQSLSGYISLSGPSRTATCPSLPAADLIVRLALLQFTIGLQFFVAEPPAGLLSDSNTAPASGRLPE